jgi:signal recognition particle receptor subunit beta
MVQINFGQKQINAKIVYYGPGMSGKTTNLEIVHQRAPQPNKGELTSISTDGDRTLFFDFMPLDLGTVAGMRTCFQIYTVPGQVYYNSTRKLVLQGVDGVVFVADSSAAMVEENLESMRNLEQNLAEYGKNLATMPLIIQYNKRDLPDALPVEELNQLLNPHGAPFFEAIANSGQGVFPTLKALAAAVLESIHTQNKAGGAQPAPAAPLSTGTTGFYKAPLPRPAQPTVQAPAAVSAHQTAGAGVASGASGGSRLQQTGQFPAGAMQPRAGSPMSGPGTGAPTSIPLGGGDPLSRTAIHAPPSHAGMAPSQPPMGSGGSLGTPGGRPPAFAPQQQMGAGGGAGSPGSLRQTGFTPRAPSDPSQASGGSSAPAPGIGLHIVRPSNDPHGAQGGGRPIAAPRAAAPRPEAAAPRTAPAPQRAEGMPRIQPRSAPRPTPVAGSKKKSAMYTTIFVVVALVVGAVAAKMLMPFI